MSMPQKVKKEEDSGEETIGPEKKKQQKRSLSLYELKEEEDTTASEQ